MSADQSEGWEEQVAVTGRPVDVPEPNSTLASRAAARGKAVQSAENKAVTAEETKSRPRKAARRN